MHALAPGRRTLAGGDRVTPLAARRLAFTLLALVAVTAGCGHTITPSRPPDSACQAGPVTAPAGTFCGLQQQVGTAPRTVNAFLAIPFAESVSGATRWTNPVAKAPLGNFDATAFGPICPQDTSWGGRIGGLRQDEDCLSLNVWTPPGTPPAGGFPVMVYIYGGAFLHGSNADPLLNGASLAASQGVVVVSANYRIGALGFLAGELGNATFTGNYAILDQQLALEWVHTNIAAFGGNPANVTIFGESAGAISVGLHLLSVPSSGPLFKAAIIESDPMGVPVKSAADAQIVTDAFAKALHCDTSPDPRQCLQAIPPGSLSESRSIIAAQQSSEVLSTVSLSLGLETFVAWGPYLDGTLVTQLPIAGAMRGALSKPTIIGTNRNEADVFISAFPDSVFQQDCYAQLVKFSFGADGSAILARPAYAVTGNPATNKKTFIEILGSRLFTCADQAVARQSGLAHVYAYHLIHHSDWQSNTLFASRCPAAMNVPSGTGLDTTRPPLVGRRRPAGYPEPRNRFGTRPHRSSTPTRSRRRARTEDGTAGVTVSCWHWAWAHPWADSCSAEPPLHVPLPACGETEPFVPA